MRDDQDPPHFFDSSRPVPGFQQPRQLFAEEKELSRFI
jgi:hypothetical protein